MLKINDHEPLARAAAQAIRSGDVAALEQLLRDNPDLANAVVCDRKGGGRTLLHIVTDWPGHFPNGPATVAALLAAGADVNGCMAEHPNNETPLHWAASSDDVAVLDALLAAGADIEAPGSVIDGGPPLADAVAFGQWQAARRLVERGARVNLWQAAALGLMPRVEELCAAPTPPTAEDITNAFWCACHGGQRAPAEYLLQRGADLNWVGYGGNTPLDEARNYGAEALVHWLESQGARSAKG